MSQNRGIHPEVNGNFKIFYDKYIKDACITVKVGCGWRKKTTSIQWDDLGRSWKERTRFLLADHTTIYMSIFRQGS